MVRQTYRRRGAGYLTPAEYFGGPAQPSGPAQPNSSLTAGSNGQFLRLPIAASSYVPPAQRGGFAPAVMGAFTANVQSAIVPLALLALYAITGVKRSNAQSVTRRNNVSNIKSKKGGYWNGGGDNGNGNGNGRGNGNGSGASGNGRGNGSGASGNGRGNGSGASGNGSGASGNGSGASGNGSGASGNGNNNNDDD